MLSKHSRLGHASGILKQNDLRPAKRARLEDSCVSLDEFQVHVGQADSVAGATDVSKPQDYVGVWSHPEFDDAHHAPVLVERGIKIFHRALSIFVRIHDTAHWLLTIREGDVKSIVLLEEDWSRLRDHPFWGLGFERLSSVTVTVSTTGEAFDHGIDLILLEGPPSSLDRWFSTIPPEVPLLTLGHGVKKRHFGDACMWTRLRHSQFGGVTNATHMFGARGLNKMQFGPCVIRCIRHIIKYSERPKICPATGAPVGQRVYSPDDRLSVDALDIPIVYQTAFACTGLGIRSFTCSELGDCFDLPLWVIKNTEALEFWRNWVAGPNFIPLKLTSALLNSAVGCLERRLGLPVAQMVNSLGPPLIDGLLLGRPSKPSATASPRTFLPSIGKHLSHDWILAGEVSDKAVKSDDALVQNGMWDKRISDPYASFTPRVLEALRRLGHRCYCRSLWRSLRTYIYCRYGQRWLHAYCEEKYGADKFGVTWTVRLREDLTKAFLKLEYDQPVRTASRYAHRVVHGLSVGWPLYSKAGHASAPSSESDRAYQRRRGVWEQSRDVTAMRQELDDAVSVLTQNCGSDWWNWKLGSRLVFWRWNFHDIVHNGTNQLDHARLGMPIYVAHDLPTTLEKQRTPPSEWMDQVVEKLQKVLDRNYVVDGRVISLTNVFHVEKGEFDIRLVYNGTSSGLNAALWAPGFYLPNAYTAARQSEYTSFCVDVDLGDFFLNFMMDPAIRPYAGIDLTPFVSRLKLDHRLTEEQRLWMRWDRSFMGGKPSPYNTIRAYYVAEEIARGPSNKEDSPLFFDQIIMNIPGSEKFDPSLPWVFRWDSLRKVMAGDLVAYVDDLRAVGYSVENTWAIARRFCSILQYMGIQDAPRKRRPPSQSPGA